jgi:urease accessory protein
MYGAAFPFDRATPPATAPVMQRARGHVRVALRRRGDTTVLAALRQEGCLKARLPRAVNVGWADVVLLNSSGGIASGDMLSTRIDAAPGACASIAAQAAERFYRAMPGSAPARVSTMLDVSSGASLEWLPQESILFDGAALDRRLEIELAPDAWFLGVEWLLFGRAARGEQVERAWLRDTIRMRRDGRLILHDAMRLEGPVRAALDRPAIGGGARAVATILHAAPDADQAVDMVRAALMDFPVEAGVSAWDGMLIARLVALDGMSLRNAVTAGLQALRRGRTLPRMWQC